jgi:hypothetical protein
LATVLNHDTEALARAQAKLKLGNVLFALAFGLPASIACLVIIRLGNKLDNGGLFLILACIIVPAFYQFWRRHFVKSAREMIEENQSGKDRN